MNKIKPVSFVLIIRLITIFSVVINILQEWQCKILWNETDVTKLEKDFRSWIKFHTDGVSICFHLGHLNHKFDDKSFPARFERCFAVYGTVHDSHITKDGILT